MQDSDQNIWVEGQIQHETDAAYLLDVGKAKPVWLPKSQVEWRFKSKTGLDVFDCPSWLAAKKGLI